MFLNLEPCALYLVPCILTLPCLSLLFLFPKLLIFNLFLPFILLNLSAYLSINNLN